MSSILKSIVVFHPSPYMVETLDNLLLELLPKNVKSENLIIPDLLDRAIAGITDELREEVRSAFSKIDNADSVILCSCSTYGGLAEEIGKELNIKAIRIDRPMAEFAVQIGKRIGIVAAASSTLVPTRELLLQVANDMNKSIDLKEFVAETAWEKKQAGDNVGYLDEVVKTIREIASEVDVILLAQGTMAKAADLCADLDIPVLASPVLGVKRAVKLALLC
ncbi:MAG: arylsulfatase [Acidimicrobiia bacterium]|nr:arylsulfatase [Acidimicrobiia bacterium]